MRHPLQSWCRARSRASSARPPLELDAGGLAKGKDGGAGLSSSLPLSRGAPTTGLGAVVGESANGATGAGVAGSGFHMPRSAVSFKNGRALHPRPPPLSSSAAASPASSTPRRHGGAGRQCNQRKCGWIRFLHARICCLLQAWASSRPPLFFRGGWPAGFDSMPLWGSRPAEQLAQVPADPASPCLDLPSPTIADADAEAWAQGRCGSRHRRRPRPWLAGQWACCLGC